MPVPRAEFTKAYLTHPCETCGAAPGARCITNRGKNKNEPHATRARMASEYGWVDPDEM